MIIGFYPKLQCSESSKKSATKHQLGPTQLKFQMSTFLQNSWHMSRLYVRSFQKKIKQLLQPWRLNYMILALNESMKNFFGQIHSFSLFH